MQPVTLGRSVAGARVVLTCEHATAAMPEEYGRLGLSAEVASDHIGWDIGAAAVTAELSRALDAPAVLSAASRLLIDCNRDLSDSDLIPPESCGVAIPGNAAVDNTERTRRVQRYYEPYHAAIDAALAVQNDALLLSVHSFTPELHGRPRPFDVGVLFDDYEDLAHRFARDLERAGFAVRMNEPYSGLDGLIFSARTHGRRHARRYLELEVNNRLLRCDADIRSIAGRVLDAVRAVSREV